MLQASLCASKINNHTYLLIKTLPSKNECVSGVIWYFRSFTTQRAQQKFKTKQATEKTTSVVKELFKQALAKEEEKKYEEAASLMEQAEKLCPKDPKISYNLGFFYSLVGDKQRAYQAFKRCIDAAIEKKNWNLYSKALFQTALLLHDQNELKDAEYFYKQAIKVNPKYVDAYINLAGLFFSQRQFEKAKTWIKRALKRLKMLKSKDTMKIALAHKTYGCILPEFKKTTLALKHLQRAYELNKKDAHVPAVIGELYETRGQINDAIRWFHTALTINPKLSQVYFRLGEIYANPDWAVHNLLQAKSYMATGLQLEPTNPNAQFALAAIHFELKEYDDAKKLLTKLKENETDNERRYLTLMMLAQIVLDPGQSEIKSNSPSEKKEFEEAIKYLREAAELQPNNLETYENLACCYIAMGQIAAAKSELHKILQLKPDHAGAYALLSRLAYEESNYENAFEMAQKAISIDPKNKNALYLLGRLYFDQGRTDEAKQYLEQALAALPSPSLASAQRSEEMKLSLMEQMSYAFDGLLVLGQIYQQQKDFTNAIRCYKSALSYDSDNVDALLLLGAAQVEAELYEDAVHVLRKASLLDPDSVMANLYLGNSLLNLQKYEQAIIYLQKALTNAMKTQASKEIVVMLYQSLASAYSKNGNELEAEQFRAYYRQLMSRDRKSVV